MLQLGDKIKIILALFFLFSCSKEQSTNVPDFDGIKAFSYIEKQCEFGPRNPGSVGHKEFSIYLERFLKEYNQETEEIQNKNPFDKKVANALANGNVEMTIKKNM